MPAVLRTIDAPDAVAPMSRYAQAMEVTVAARWLFVSGQIPVAPDGSLPEGFAAQARQAWANVEAQLRAASMGFEDLVKVTIFLADRADAVENRRVREEVLGGRRVALTAILPAIFDAAWLIEIEAVAAA
jgi:enamine deaminase RidA (YjgF/YER057c/UK114 family)